MKKENSLALEIAFGTMLIQKNKKTKGDKS